MFYSELLVHFFKCEHLVLVLVFSVKQHLLEPLAPLDLIGKVRRPRLKKPQYQNDHDRHCIVLVWAITGTIISMN